VEPGVPVGGEEDFAVLEHVGTPRDFTAEGFEPRDHVDLGRLLGAIDVERGAKVSGARFYYLTGPGALLELALVNLAVQQAVSAGFIPMYPPVLVKPPAMEGTGFLGQAAENVFHLEQDDFYLVGTSEVALAAYHMDEILDADSLPRRYAGISSCFRREAGTYGKDTRGIIRVHQFDKVEMFSFCAPEDAEEEHRRLLAWEREFLDRLDVPYRVIDVASGDLGASAVRKFDCEAWIPTQGRYREVTSTSNCTSFQARRLNVRMREGDGVRPVATLNGTLVAIPRVIVALLENHQQTDGSVRVPEALQPYLGTDLLSP
jgi:seryl-tRNA synthetase